LCASWPGDESSSSSCSPSCSSLPLAESAGGCPAHWYSVDYSIVSTSEKALSVLYRSSSSGGATKASFKFSFTGSKITIFNVSIEI